MVVFFGVTPGVYSISRHFEASNKKHNGEKNLVWNVNYFEHFPEFYHKSHFPYSTFTN